jgi:integrase/recombinase XerD
MHCRKPTFSVLTKGYVILCAAAGVLDGDKSRYTLHQLRHTAGTEFIRHYPEHIVSRMLGHRDPRSTRRYAEVTEEQVRATLAQRRGR